MISLIMQYIKNIFVENEQYISKIKNKYKEYYKNSGQNFVVFLAQI